MSNILRRFVDEFKKNVPRGPGPHHPPPGWVRPEAPEPMRGRVDKEAVGRAFDVASVKTEAFGGGELARIKRQLERTSIRLAERDAEIAGLKTEIQALVDTQLDLQEQLAACMADNRRLQAVIEGNARDRAI